MKRTSLALAASLVFGNAVAEENKLCTDIVESFQWNIFTVTQRADTVNSKLCLKFSTDNEVVKQVLMKESDDTSPVVKIAEEGCISVMGSETQGLTPMIIQTNGEVTNLMTLRVGQALEVYNAMVKDCMMHPSAFSPVRFEAPKVGG